jgi:hypothetical protein
MTTPSPSLMSDDPYERLGLVRAEIEEMSPDKANVQVKAAYRKLARKYHPDNRKTGHEPTFVAIGEAFTALSDAEGREAFAGGGSLAGLKDGVVIDLAGAMQDTFGEEFVPPPATAKDTARAAVRNSSRVVRPGTWIVTEEEKGWAKIGVCMMAVFAILCIVERPFLPAAIHWLPIFVVHLAKVPGVAWALFGIMLLVLLAIPHTRWPTLEALRGTAKAVYVFTKLTIIMVRLCIIITAMLYRRLQSWRTARSNTP